MYKKHHNRNQHGIATLGITLMLLFVMTLVALYTAKTSIKEQQISANQYRAEQSLSTANAALDWGVAYLSEAGGFFCDDGLVGVLENYFSGLSECPVAAEYDRAIMCTIKDDEQDKCRFTYYKTNPLEIGPDETENALSIGSSEMYYAFVKVDGTELPYIPVKGGIGERLINDGDGVTRIYYANIKVYGIGRSDDETGMRVVSLDVDTSNIFGDPGLGASAFPLITKAATDTNANTAVVNRFDNRTIWSGNELGISGSTNTYVLKEGLGWNCNDIAKHDECVKELDQDGIKTVMKASDGQNTVNADIIDGDGNLANLGSNDFFKNFFGKTKGEMKALAKDAGLYVETDGGDTLTDQGGNVYVWKDLKDHTPLVWIDVSGAEYSPNGNQMGQIGTEDDPMVVIIDGNLGINGVGNVGKILVGALYVTGYWDASANMVVQGMMIVETSSGLSGAGTPTLIYDADLFNGKLGPPPGTIAGIAQGTWKDWE